MRVDMRVGRLTISHSGARWDAELPAGVATIGRYYEGSTNIVNLPAEDLSISRVHAEIESKDGAFVLRNRSGNGTLVNGRPVDQIELNPGDRIRIGTAEIVFAVTTVQPAAPAGGIRLGTAVDSTAITQLPVPDGATEAFDSDALRQMNLSVQQQEVIAAAKAIYTQQDTPAGMPPVLDQAAVAQNVKAGYEVREKGVQAARSRAKAQAQAKPKQESTNPVVLMAGAVAIVVLLLVVMVDTSTDAGPDTFDQAKTLSAQYKGWLEKQAETDPSIKVDARVTELERRMQAIAWAERVGRSADMRHELQVLLQMDGDRSSPVYQYAAGRLRGL